MVRICLKELRMNRSIIITYPFSGGLPIATTDLDGDKLALVWARLGRRFHGYTHLVYLRKCRSRISSSVNAAVLGVCFGDATRFHC